MMVLLSIKMIKVYSLMPTYVEHMFFKCHHSFCLIKPENGLVISNVSWDIVSSKIFNN